MFSYSLDVLMNFYFGANHTDNLIRLNGIFDR